MHLVRGSWWGRERDRMRGWEDTPDLLLVNYSLRRAVIRVWPLCWLIITWLPYWIQGETFENLYFKSSSDLFDQRCISGTIIWIKEKVKNELVMSTRASSFICNNGVAAVMFLLLQCVKATLRERISLSSVSKNNQLQHKNYEWFCF